MIHAFNQLKTACRLVLCMALFAGMSTASQAQTEVPAAQANTVKQALAQRLPDLPPIAGVRTTPVPGLFEVRTVDSVYYVDAKGDYLIDGHLMDTRSRRNLTEERLDEINKIDFATLPLQDAVVWKNGSGKRKLVVFSDPNCGYCKRLEKSFNDIKDVTVYTFMIGILGEDSKTKSDSIWCIKDRTQAWRDWMLQGREPSRTFGMCASPLKRNMALAQKLRVNGTPALFFEDGSRVAAAIPADVIEQKLSKASGKAGG